MAQEEALERARMEEEARIRREQEEARLRKLKEEADEKERKRLEEEEKKRMEQDKKYREKVEVRTSDQRITCYVNACLGGEEGAREDGKASARARGKRESS